MGEGEGGGMCQCWFKGGGDQPDQQQQPSQAAPQDHRQLSAASSSSWVPPAPAANHHHPSPGITHNHSECERVGEREREREACQPRSASVQVSEARGGKGGRLER